MTLPPLGDELLQLSCQLKIINCKLKDMFLVSNTEALHMNGESREGKESNLVFEAKVEVGQHVQTW